MTWWLYLLLVNLYLGLFFGFYAVFLRRETFFQLNRVYLVASAVLSFLIPGIHAQWVQDLFITKQVQQTIYHTAVMQYQFQVAGPQKMTIGDVLIYVYGIGAAILAARFVWQLITLNKFMDADKEDSAYSFFNKINTGAEDNDVIEAHERAHAGQWHSVDVLLVEALAIINWFNPVVYLYKKAIRHIHEFIADRQALKGGTSKSEYAMLLLSQTFQTPAHSLVNPFFKDSMIKQRIMMLQKDRSNRAVLIKYCLSVPLFILMLILSSATVDRSYTIRIISAHAKRLFDSPADPAVIMLDELTKPTNKVTVTATAKNTNLKLSVSKKKDSTASSEITIDEADRMPEYKGGMDDLYKFLGKYLRYPAALREKGIEGRVIVSFIVETDGSLSDIKVLRDIGGGAGDEVVRVLKMTDKWVPGIRNGKVFRTGFTIPIFFALQHEEATADTTAKNSITITGVKGAVSNLTVSLDSTQLAKKRFLILDGKTPGIYIVDGVKVDNIDHLDTKTITSMSVLKGQEYVGQYGQLALNGVIIIKTKPKIN